MHKTKLAKRLFSVLMAQALAVSMACAGPLTALTTYAEETSSTESDSKVDKDEVVYVITNGDGDIDDIIVSDKLNNNDGSSTIEDKTDLTDIENVKGDEEYSEGSDDSISWAADGNSITYQGNSTKDLPVDVKLSYKLDGQPISADELAGKSGKVTIRFDYENKETRKVTVDGKEYEVYVPFTMVSGAILDSDKFSNVEVENGKAITEGDKTIVFGYAVPGLKESLDIDEDLLDDADVDMPEYVEITADVKDFELGMTMTAVSNDLLDSVDSDDIGTDDMQESIDDLADATDQLVDGTSSLSDGTSSAYDGAKKIASNMGKLATGTKTLKQAIGVYTNGVDTLYSKVPTLVTGVNTLNTGASKLATGAASLKTGTESYVAGVDTLANGLLGDGTSDNPGYIGGVEQLAAGAKQLSGLSKLGDVSSAITQMKSATGKDGKKTLGYGSAAVVQGLDQVIDSLGTLKESTSGQALTQLAQGLSSANQLATAASTQAENAQALTQKASSVVSAASGEVATQQKNVEKAASDLQDEKDALDAEIQEKNDKISEKNREIADAQKSVNDKIDSVNDTIGKVNDKIDTVNDKINTVNDKVEDTNKDISSSVDKTIEELKKAKSALEKAETDDVKFTDEKKAIQKQIDDLEAKKVDKIDVSKVDKLDKVDKMEFKEDTVSEFKKTETSVDTTEISTQKLDGYAAALGTDGTISTSLAAISSAYTEQIIPPLTQIGTALSSASTKMGTQPIDTLITGLNQIKSGAEQVQSGVSDLHSSLGTLESATSSFPQAAEGVKALIAGFDKVTANDGTLKTGAKQLLDNGSVLTAGVKEVADGSSQLSTGTSTLASGAKTLSTGVGTLASNNDKLNDGASTLATGASALSTGSGQLTSGMSQLLDGAEQLKDGMAEYKDEGISKILDLYNDDIVGIKDRFKALQEAGKSYQTYTQLADGDKGSVKFIYKSDEIKVDDEDDE